MPALPPSHIMQYYNYYYRMYKIARLHVQQLKKEIPILNSISVKDIKE
jgi:hypothetical protein